MNIRHSLAWLMVTGATGFLIFAAVAFIAQSRVEINGPIYQEISLSRDVVIDYIPPSQNLMGAALICQLMADTTDPERLARYQSDLTTAHRLYERRQANYQQRVPSGSLKDLMFGAANVAALEFYAIAERDYVPLLLRGDSAAAREVLRSRMMPVYEQHAAQIDRIVALAASESRASEVRAKWMVDAYTVQMVSVGLLVAVVAALLFVMISRAITAQTDKLRLSHQALEKAHSHVEEQVRERTAELQVAKEQAESADRTKSAFLAVMSHELRTPLNSIIGFTDIVIRELPGPLNAEQKKQLGMVQNSGRHLLALINDVLDISKIEAGELKLQPAPFDVGKSVVKVTDIIRPQAGSKQLALSVEVQSGIGAVTGDARRFEQILLNLLSNAVKFTERGSVAVRCISQGGWLEVQVEDTGMGIAPEDLALLFQPFKQVDSRLARKFEGTGLGLSICKRLAQMMGGTISVSSEPGRGSTFAVRLPIIGETQ